MKSQEQIEQAANVLADAAVFSMKTNDKESYEVASTATMVLGWVLDEENGTAAVDALLRGATWAQNQLQAKTQ